MSDSGLDKGRHARQRPAPPFTPGTRVFHPVRCEYGKVAHTYYDPEDGRWFCHVKLFRPGAPILTAAENLVAARGQEGEKS